MGKPNEVSRKDCHVAKSVRLYENNTRVDFAGRIIGAQGGGATFLKSTSVETYRMR